jgi:hypothetical protein
LTLTVGLPSVNVSNVLTEDKKQQVIALGRLGWSLRRIERATGVRRETAAGYLKSAGIALRPPGGWGRPPAKPAIEVSTGLEPGNPRPDAEPQPGSRLSASACEPYREIIEGALSRGRNAMAVWQDLVDGHGFTGRYASVKRFVRQLRGSPTPDARVVIETAPGEDYGESGVMVREAFPVACPSPGSLFCDPELSITLSVENNVIPPPVQSERNSRCFRTGSPVTISNTTERHHTNRVLTLSQAVCCDCSTRAK